MCWPVLVNISQKLLLLTIDLANHLRRLAKVELVPLSLIDS